jgi:hypothetical protein
LLVFWNACSKNNAGIVKQTYHDLTSHYNGYFNGNEHFNVHLKNLEKSRKENYQEILPLFAYGNIDEIKSQNAALNTSIEKARLSIQTHQEKTSSKNYLANEDNSISNWSDNAFILIGKSYYLQGEMDSAISCFRYVTANFEEGVDARSKEKIKKQKSNKKRKEKEKKLEDKLIDLQKKGKDIRPSKKISLHEASYTEALVWLVKAYVSNQQYGEADAILTYARANQDFLKDYDPELELSNAFLYLEQDNYNSALPYVEKALSLIKKQKNKARLQFVLAQLYEKNEQSSFSF